MQLRMPGKIGLRSLAVSSLILIGARYTMAEIKTKTVEYTVGGVVMEGYLAWDDSFKEPRPGVLVIHEWKGLEDYAQNRAEAVAKLGYVAFAADMYGKGVRPKTREEAMEQAGKLKNDRPLTRARVKAALEVLKQQSGVDPHRLAAIGYCFGGMTVLELARSGADVKGIVSFHGSYDTETPQDMKTFKGKALILQGSADQASPPEKVAALQKELTDAGVDWQMVLYGGAVHAFTNPAAGNDPSTGAAYNPVAAGRAWEAMKGFLGELFGK